MASITKEYINNIMSKLIPTLSITDSKYEIDKFENMAQNYFGVIIPVAVTGKFRNETTNIDLVLKLAPIDERFRVSGAVTLMFAREIYIYSTVLAKYREYQSEFPLNLQYLVPQLYYVSKKYCQEILVMQNMCQKGFTPYVENSFLDYDHVIISLQELAKFHALSFIMKKKDTKLYEETKEVCVPLTNEFNKRFMDILLDRLQKAIQKLKNTIYEDILRNFEKNCVRYVEDAAYSVHGLCIGHGDIWKENILFKYENGRPNAVCLIDYQASRMCSPAFDALYLIATSTDSCLRKKHFPELINIYYEKFVQVLVYANLEPDKIYSRQNLNDDLNLVSAACFIVANCALWLSQGLQQEGHVRSKNVYNTPQEKEAAVIRYKSIISDIIEDFKTYGYI